MKQVHPDLKKKNNKQKMYIYIYITYNRLIDVTWSDSIAHQTCSSGTHGVVGHIFHHHPTRKASSDSLPRNWYQVIYIYISSFIWIMCAITRHAFHLKIHIQRGSHVLQFSICSHCGMSMSF